MAEAPNQIAEAASGTGGFGPSGGSVALGAPRFPERSFLKPVIGGATDAIRTFGAARRIVLRPLPQAV